MVCCAKAPKVNVKVSDSLKMMFIKDKLYGVCGVVNEAGFADCFNGKKPSQIKDFYAATTAKKNGRKKTKQK